MDRGAPRESGAGIGATSFPGPPLHAIDPDVTGQLLAEN